MMGSISLSVFACSAKKTHQCTSRETRFRAHDRKLRKTSRLFGAGVWLNWRKNLRLTYLRDDGLNYTGNMFESHPSNLNIFSEGVYVVNRNWKDSFNEVI